MWLAKTKKAKLPWILRSWALNVIYFYILISVRTVVGSLPLPLKIFWIRSWHGVDEWVEAWHVSGCFSHLPAWSESVTPGGPVTFYRGVRRRRLTVIRRVMKYSARNITVIRHCCHSHVGAELSLFQVWKINKTSLPYRWKQSQTKAGQLLWLPCFGPTSGNSDPYQRQELSFASVLRSRYLWKLRIAYPDHTLSPISLPASWIQPV